MIWKPSDDEEKLPETVDIDTWWRAMESKMLEAVVYKDAKMEPVVTVLPRGYHHMPWKCGEHRAYEIEEFPS